MFQKNGRLNKMIQKNGPLRKNDQKKWTIVPTKYY